MEMQTMEMQEMRSHRYLLVPSYSKEYTIFNLDHVIGSVIMRDEVLTPSKSNNFPGCLFVMCKASVSLIPTIDVIFADVSFIAETTSSEQLSLNSLEF